MESYTLHFIIFSKFFFIYKKFKLEFYCIFLIKNLYILLIYNSSFLYYFLRNI